MSTETLNITAFTITTTRFTSHTTP